MSEGRDFKVIAQGEGSLEAEMIGKVQARMKDAFFQLGMNDLRHHSPSVIFMLMAACLGNLYGKSRYWAEAGGAPHGWTGSDEEVAEIAATFSENAQLNYVVMKEKH
jgi:hypothetical protein